MIKCSRVTKLIEILWNTFDYYKKYIIFRIRRDFNLIHITRYSNEKIVIFFLFIYLHINFWTRLYNFILVYSIICKNPVDLQKGLNCSYFPKNFYHTLWLNCIVIIFTFQRGHQLYTYYYNIIYNIWKITIKNTRIIILYYYRYCCA